MTSHQSFGHRLWLAGVVALLAACAPSVPALPPLPADAIILAFGDSLTAGNGAGKHNSYPAALERLTGRRVVNAGVPGELSDAGLKRLGTVLENHRPDLLILCHGGNDLLRKHSREALAQNLRAMVRLAKERGVGVVLIGVPAPGIILASAPLYQAVADELNLPYEGDLLPELESSPSLKSDPIHLNAQGYQLMAEGVFKLLRRAGAL
jgi:acyl-CoA thioesterase-1